ncbi:transient receptor potential cation channel subfamily A member 1-like [Saccoglossus kowalevskii]|uniref:Transient receptor potential cation channel subfamily A member 1-like n=1 Tax=Saccoglossus kowalevskii TaxID=10224 RepID=A0ABM0MUB9_SACKO|nr:PREDICTED: transient receptor potential cation channel subfamily A member 1-like [Saccoglossus kowalevskii]
MAGMANGSGKQQENVPLQPIENKESDSSKQNGDRSELAKARWKKAISFVVANIKLDDAQFASSNSEDNLAAPVIDVDDEGDDEQSTQRSLHDLACDRHITVLEAVLEKNENLQINLCDRAGRTALQCAVERQSVKAVELLLSHGAEASVTIPGSDDKLFHQAVRTGNIEIVRLMIAALKDTEINTRGNDGYRPLHAAILKKNNVVNIELLDNGADINAENDTNTTPFLLATEKADISTMRMLIAYKPAQRASKTKHKVYKGRTLVNVNHKDLTKRTALMFAASQGNVQKISLLIRYGALLSAIDCQGQTILHKAVGNLKTLELLLRYGEIKKLLEKKDKYGNTALHYAAGKFIDNVELLIKHGAKPNVRNKKGKTPLHFAVRNRRLDIVNLLLNSLPGDDDERYKSLGTDYPRTRLLNSEDKTGKTALHIAASLDFVEIVKELQERGAYITSTHEGHYPIHLASNNGCVNTVKLLLERDSEWLAWPDNDGNTPVHHAAWKGHVALVAYLLDANTPILENNKGANCLDLAIKTGEDDVCMEIAKHDKWRQCLRKNHRGQLRTLVNEMPDVASKFMDNFKQPTTDDSGKHGFTYDFSYYKKDDDKSHHESSPLQAMMNCGNCIDHEIVVKFLEVGWDKFGFLMYIMMLVFYMLYLGSLCALVWIDGPLRRNINGTLVDTKKDDTDKGHFGVQSSLALVVLLAACIEVLILLSKLYIDPRSYLGFVTIMDWIKCIGTLLYVIPYFYVSIDENFERNAGAIAIFFSWICLILCLQSLPVFGIYVILIKNHVWTIVKVCPIFMLPLFAFGFAFYTMLSAQLPFKHLVQAVLTSWVMMLGEMDYESRILGSAAGIQGALVFLFIAFCIVAIVVMNLLVALAVGDMQEVMDSAAKERLLVQMQLFLGLERHVLTKLVLCITRKDTTNVFPDKYVEVNKEKKNILKLMQSVVENVLGGEEEDKKESGGDSDAVTSEDTQYMKEKLEHMEEQLHELHSLIRSFIGDAGDGSGSKDTV